MASTEPAVVRFSIDARRSRFTVRAFASGMLSALGHSPTISIRDFSGKAQWLPGASEGATLRVSIKADSLVVADQVSDKDRAEIERAMREEVLETTRYLEIAYESTSITSVKIFEGQYRVSINGKLSLHGVTREFPINSQVLVSEDSLRASGEFTLQQSHFRIKPFSAAGGTIKLKGELKFAFDIVARKESA